MLGLYKHRTPVLYPCLLRISLVLSSLTVPTNAFKKSSKINVTPMHFQLAELSQCSFDSRIFQETHSNPTQESEELNVQFRKEIWQVCVCGSDLERCLHRESWLCLHYIMTLVITCPGAVTHASPSPIKPGYPEGQKQSETSVSSVRSPIALCTKQLHNKCV